MGLWSWAKEKLVGEVLHDYGEVFSWTQGGETTRLNVQLSHADGRVFLFTRTTSTAFLSKNFVYSKIEVTEDDLERFRSMLADARLRIQAKRQELAGGSVPGSA